MRRLVGLMFFLKLPLESLLVNFLEILWISAVKHDSILTIHLSYAIYALVYSVMPDLLVEGKMKFRVLTYRLVLSVICFLNVRMFE